MQTKTKKKDFISMADISHNELMQLLQLTKEIKLNPNLKSKSLSNKAVALIFAKPSLRTRVSFEVGVHQLGGFPLTIKMDEINIGTREDTEDIAKVLSRYVSAIVIRTFEQKQIEELGRFSTVPVINGLSNDEHPCQVLTDIFTISEIFPKLDGLKLAFIGDGNNVAHSLLIGASLTNMNIAIGSPKSFEVKDSFVNAAKKINPKINIELTNNPQDAAKDAHVLYTDVWTSMGQEKEAIKRREIFAPYQINNELLSYADKNAIVLHCLPAHKGEEITKEVFEKYSSIIFEQAENRLHTQKAILLNLISE